MRTNKKQLISNIFDKLSLKENYGIFGDIAISIHTENFKEKLPDKIPANIKVKKDIFNPAENEKYKYFLLISFKSKIPGVGEAIDFHFCNSECAISTWFLCTGDKKMEHHPFALSWFRFIEKNGYKTEDFGLDGHGNFRFIPTKEGISFLMRWIDWVILYSD